MPANMPKFLYNIPNLLSFYRIAVVPECLSTSNSLSVGRIR